MWIVELCAWVLGYLWDSLSLAGIVIAAICATVGYFVVRHKKASSRRGGDMAAMGGEDDELTPEQEEEELQRVLRESMESFEREKKYREKNRAPLNSRDENRYDGEFAIPNREEWSQMPFDDRVRIARNLAEVDEGDGDGLEVLEQLPPEERPKLLGEMGKRKVVAAKLARRRAGGDGEDPFLPPPVMPPPRPRSAGARGATGGVAEGASSLPRNEEEEELQLALSLSLSDAQARGSTPGATAAATGPSPPTTPQRKKQQVQPRLSDQDDEEFQRAVQLSLNPENSLSQKEREEQQMKKAMEQSARESLEDEMAARALSKKALRVPGSLRPVVIGRKKNISEHLSLSHDGQNYFTSQIIDGMNVGFAHGNDQKFSAQGLMIAFDFFRNMGWEIENIKIFVKRNRKFHEAAQEDKDLCERMNKASIVVWPMGNYDDL